MPTKTRISKSNKADNGIVYRHGSDSKCQEYDNTPRKKYSQITNRGSGWEENSWKFTPTDTAANLVLSSSSLTATLLTSMYPTTGWGTGWWRPIACSCSLCTPAARRRPGRRCCPSRRPACPWTRTAAGSPSHAWSSEASRTTSAALSPPRTNGGRYWKRRKEKEEEN